MKSVPVELLELVRKVASSEAEVGPLSWTYEDEDYDIAVIVPDTVSYEEARHVEDVCSMRCTTLRTERSRSA
jgi:hypothetical protein